jgi:hypothetical protein
MTPERWALLASIVAVLTAVVYCVRWGVRAILRWRSKPEEQRAAREQQARSVSAWVVVDNVEADEVSGHVTHTVRVLVYVQNGSRQIITSVGGQVSLYDRYERPVKVEYITPIWIEVIPPGGQVEIETALGFSGATPRSGTIMLRFTTSNGAHWVLWQRPHRLEEVDQAHRFRRAKDWGQPYGW